MKVRSIVCFLFLSLSVLPLAGRDQEVKKGGIFKFGKKEEGVSSGLFPDQSSTEKKRIPGKEGENMFIRPVTDPTKPKPKAEPKPEPKPEPIPEKIGPPSPKPAAEKKKGGFFSFGKKSTKVPSKANTVITPVPEKVSPQYPKPATHSISIGNEKPVAVPTTANTTREKEKSGKGLFSFFPGKKKNSGTETDLKAIADSSMYQGVAHAPTAQTGSPQLATPASSPPTAPNAMPPGDQIVAQTVTVANTQTKKEKHKVGFPSLSMPSLPKLKMPGKKTNYKSVETVMKDGVFVEKTDDTGTTFSNAPTAVSNPSGQKRPPTIVNGVKTYSTWDDVEGKTSSAADKILRQLR